MLRNAEFKPVYATGEDEPVEFFINGLMNSNTFDLGLGYFSTSAINTLSIGFAYFIKNGGSVRIIINHALSAEDKEAILKGQRSPELIIEEELVNNVIRLKNTLSKRDAHFFKCLSWLIANHRIEIKAVIPKNSEIGIVHQKFGFFRDTAGDKVVFTGSTNFSKTALIHNVEDLSCDFSWSDDVSIKARIAYFERIFQKSWDGTSDTVTFIPIEKVKTVIQDEFSTNLDLLLREELELINDLRAEKGINTAINALDSLSNRIGLEQGSGLYTSFPTLRDYQEEAISSWEKNNHVGLFEMATGTGKTITALTAGIRLGEKRKRLVIIVSCPFIHLAEQWKDEAKIKFGLDGLLIGESKELWENQASRQAQLFRRGKIDKILFITTNASFKSESFQKIIAANVEDTLIIIDEAHYIGAYTIRQSLPQGCKFRLGLSATPDRYGDDEGTAAIYDYFDKTVFSFPIEKAIGTYLTKYYYYPILIELTESEFEEYCNLTLQIGRLAGRNDDVSLDKLEKLAIKRARVQNNAVNKLLWVRNHIPALPVDFSLFYAGDKIFADVKRLLGQELRIRIHEFTSRQTRGTRKDLLEDFASQKIQSLIAMKCLDEGVDVPPTRVAYFLASSGNPREFIQRRGRVLRKFPGKDFSIIYDLISMPPQKYIQEGRDGDWFSAVKSAFSKEYKRAAEFAKLAENQFDSINELFSIANNLNLLDTI